MRIVVTSQYGTLSRGRHSARLGGGNSVEWARKEDNGDIVINRDGAWQLHCTDGFARTARAVLRVSVDGGWTISGDVKRFTVLSVE